MSCLVLFNVFAFVLLQSRSIVEGFSNYVSENFRIVKDNLFVKNFVSIKDEIGAVYLIDQSVSDLSCKIRALRAMRLKREGVIVIVEM